MSMAEHFCKMELKTHSATTDTAIFIACLNIQRKQIISVVYLLQTETFFDGADIGIWWLY